MAQHNDECQWESQSIPIMAKFSPTYLNRNLTINSDGSVAFVHRNKIVMLKYPSGNTSGTISLKEDICIMNVSWVQMDDQQGCFIFGTTEGVQFWDEEGLKMLYFMNLTDELARDELHQDKKGPLDPPEYTFCPGLAWSAANQDVLVGSSTGHIFVIHHEDSDLNFARRSVLRPNGESISAMACSGDVFVSAYDSGAILTWDTSNGEYTVLREIPRVTKDVPYGITNVLFARDGREIIASYVTGHIRMFRLSTGTLRCEIAAHSRAITALDVYRDEYLLSTGEDTFVNVWKIPHVETKTSVSVDLVMSERMPDKLIMGGKFTAEGDILTSVYDSEALELWTLK